MLIKRRNLTDEKESSSIILRSGTGDYITHRMCSRKAGDHSSRYRDDRSSVRGEALDMEEFARLTNIIKEEMEHEV